MAWKLTSIQHRVNSIHSKYLKRRQIFSQSVYETVCSNYIEPISSCDHIPVNISTSEKSAKIIGILFMQTVTYFYPKMFLSLFSIFCQQNSDSFLTVMSFTYISAIKIFWFPKVENCHFL